ncbi:MAG: amidophosphoribosyltransferase [Peptococcaceae bacterium]|nr:amidophosphoribosyltransferase [Peptococcaceae bacterium]
MACITDDGFHEECGVFAICAPGMDVAHLTYLGLFALQHRGQEGCGMAVWKDGNIQFHKRLGLVNDVFNEEILESLPGSVAIGHVRYATTGETSELNTQPIVAQYYQGQLALAHNGNLTNTEALREALAKTGSLFQTATDTEVLCNLLARYAENSLDVAMEKAMAELEGSYALVAINDGKIFAARDPYGNRPLCIGKLAENAGYVVASESCALDTIEAEFVRDVEPGEILVIDETGIHTAAKVPSPRSAHCIFEYVYFARPDSTIDGVNVNQSRRRMGAILARETGDLDVDIVIPVPDSGTTAAIGYAEASGKQFTQGILKNRYTARTFIQPTQAMREKMVKLKLSPIREEIGGKRVAVVDDSIVRGTTSKRLVALLRERGAAEVHMLITCPPVLYPCYYGIDTAERDKLIAANHSLEEIRQYINADSLHYISLEGLYEAVGSDDKYCVACLNGDYCLGHPNCKKKQS